MNFSDTEIKLLVDEVEVRKHILVVTAVGSQLKESATSGSTTLWWLIQ